MGACDPQCLKYPRPCMQAYWTFGWDRKFQLWCNPNDSGSSFGPHGYKLARVLWIHYVSKVRPLE